MATADIMTAFAQFWLAACGIISIWASQSATDRVRRWACVFGLTAQPAWLYATWAAEQWGMFALTIAYTIGWMRGINTFWLRPATRPARVPDAGRRPMTDLATALRELARPWLTAEQAAAHLGYASVRHFRERVAVLPDFPAPHLWHECGSKIGLALSGSGELTREERV